MVPSRALALSAVLAACAHRGAATDHEHTCDPAGPPKWFPPDFTADEWRMLTAEQMQVRPRCATNFRGQEPPFREELCLERSEFAVEAEHRDACMKVCMMDMAFATATLLHQQIFSSLERLQRALDGHPACIKDVTGDKLRGASARRLWECVGDEPLPVAMTLEIVLSPERIPQRPSGRWITRASVQGQLLPRGATYAFELGEQLDGCGTTAVGVLVRIVPAGAATMR